MKKSGWGQILIALMCGVLCAFCFDVAWLAPFVWVLLVPFFVILLKEKKKKRVLGLVVVFAAALFLCYYRAFFTLDISGRAGGMAGLYLVLGWLGASLLQGTILAAAIFFGMILPCPSYVRASLLGIIWAGAEWVFGAGVLGLPCVRLGVTQLDFLPMVQSAQIGGVLLVSALIVIVNVLLAQGILARKGNRLKRGWYVAAAAVFLLNFVFGMVRLNQPSPLLDVSVATIQYNVPFARSGGQGRFEKAVAMAQEAAKEKPDIILLPENSVYGSFMEEESLQRICADITRESGGYLFLGVYGIHGYELRNSVFMVTPDGHTADVYHKQRLVPFFENGYERPFDFDVGKNRGVFDTEYGKAGAMICFESLFSDIAADTVRKGAETLFVFTNDSWFVDEVPLNRHFAQSAVRAVETGRYVVQAGNTGVSAIVSPQGSVTQELPTGTDGVLYGDVAFLGDITPYVRAGDWWIAAGGVILMVLSWVWYKKRI